MAGLTDTGITIKSVTELLTEIEADQLANIDADLNVEPDDVLGQLNGIVAGALAEAWELLEQVYQAGYPDTASGQSLSYIAAMTGAIRQEATKATLPVWLVGTVDTVVPAGTQCYVEDDADSLFQTTADATIEEHGATDYVAVTMEAVTPGTATKAFYPADSLVISTPVSGLTSIAHLDDYTPGVDEETDAELRQRREQTLALAGASTVDAIRAEMLQVTGVDSCTVFENPTAVTDALGVPPYAIEVLVNSETAPVYVDQDIFDAILLRKPAGTESYGTTETGTATDAAGNTYTVKFTEPTTVRCWVEADLTAATDGSYVGDGNAEIAIADWATKNLLVGQDVFSSDVVNVLADLEGVISVDVTAVFVDDDATPSPNTSVVTTARELATIASADVTVTS